MGTETKQVRGKWVPLLYYYLATVVGLGILLVGLIGGLRGVVQAALPKTSQAYIYNYSGFRDFAPDGRPRKVSTLEEVRAVNAALDNARQAGIAQGMDGLIAVIVGGPVFVWHLRQARRREPEWLGLTPQ